MIDVAPEAVVDAPAPEEPRSFVRRGIVVPAVIVALLVGFGAAYLAFRGPAGPSLFAGAPSVKQFDLPASPVTTPSVTTEAPTVAEEPTSARDALDKYLTAETSRAFDVSFALLDSKTRQSGGPVASWQNTRANRLLPEQFTILGEKPVDDAVELTVAATRTPAISPVTGLIPARSQETWRVVNDGGWRVVGGHPVDVRPELPADDIASSAGAAWLDKVKSCDNKGAETLQLSANLLGSPALRDAICKSKGTWSAGKAVPVAELPNSTVFVSAYGPGVGRWGRAVPVTGSNNARYTIVLAPLGDEWRVMGVIPEGSPHP